MPIAPVVLAGGFGKRLWPISRETMPKQFHKLVGVHSLFQETLRRLQNPMFGAPTVICHAQHESIARQQANTIGVDQLTTVIEPEGRNTAAATAISTLLHTRDSEESLILILPSDQVIEPLEDFLDAIDAAKGAADYGQIVTFGVTPRSPATGYGYIRAGTKLAPGGPCYSVDEFVEKPDLDTARHYVDEGNYFWNAGIFLFKAETMLTELDTFAPDLLSTCRTAIPPDTEGHDRIELKSPEYLTCHSVSIDRAVMERTTRAAVLPVQLDWKDLGNWVAIAEYQAELSPPNGDRNIGVGDPIFVNSANCFVFSKGPLVAVVGISDLIVIAEKDAVLVGHKDAVQRVDEVVEVAKKANRSEYEYHTRVHRPWGWYEDLESGPGFRVKRIVVHPGERLSLQKHRHRSEHWVLVKGEAIVTCGDTRNVLRKNENIFIPQGEVHRIENATQEQVEIIEVQVGEYLGEDDIIRIDDQYGRV